MAFCPRSAQKIFWWLKSTSKATVLRSCSTICVYSRLSSPSFRMSLRFVKIRQGSLPAMQEMALKVWSDYQHSYGLWTFKSNQGLLHPFALWMGTCTPAWPNKRISTGDKLAPDKSNHQQWGALRAQLINFSSPAHNTISLTDCLTHSCTGVHLITLMTLAFVASFQVDANLTTDSRIQTFIDVCKGGRKHWSTSDKATTEHYSNCMNGILKILEMKLLRRAPFYSFTQIDPDEFSIINLDSVYGFTHPHRFYDRWAATQACSHIHSQPPSHGTGVSIHHCW